MKKWNVLGSVTAAALMSILMAAPIYAKEAAIPEGIYVGDVSLGGMTEAEAQEKLQALADSMAGRNVTLDLDGISAETTAGELGFAWSNPEAVQAAAEHAVEGNLIQQYMGLKDLEKDPVHIPFETAVEEAKVDAFVKEHGEGLAGEPQDATIRRENGEFVITPGKSGKVVDIAATKQAIDEALSGAADAAVTVKAEVTVAEPKVTEEDLASISDVLGTFSTDFSSSGAARSKNLTHGASKINGHVLMPGETLSGYECMHPFTTENGYHTAAAYENGQVVDSIGGGVCQIATTLYNAALFSELEITQRQNHSMIVGYVKPSRDAAIAGTYKDIKITNNYSTPIYVEGGTSGRTLTFTIYGKETRPENRTIEFVSETLSVTDPGAPTERLDPGMAPGTRRQVQSAHRGLKSQLWKVVKVDGVETERILLNKDTYNASKAVVLVGPAAPETQPEAPTEEQPEETQPTAIEGIDGGPGVGSTQGESQTPAANPSPEPSINPSPAPNPAAAPSTVPSPAPEPSANPAASPSPSPGSTPEPSPVPAPPAA